jgi:SAM-dependent methyltransferase
MDELEKIYRRRFNKDIEFRKKMYKVLCNEFYQKHVPKSSTVLDIAAGYCEFINNIKAKKKFAVDLNTDVKKFAAKNVKVINASSTKMKAIKDNSIDIAYTSNFFEHITKEDIRKTIQEVKRVLKKGGKFLILQPNIRYCYKEYWMYFDHITPLDDKSLSEVLEINGFKVIESRPRFLPFSIKSRLPNSILLLRIYLKIPLLQKLFGKQAFIVARNIKK